MQPDAEYLKWFTSKLTLMGSDRQPTILVIMTDCDLCGQERVCVIASASDDCDELAACLPCIQAGVARFEQGERDEWKG